MMSYRSGNSQWHTSGLPNGLGQGGWGLPGSTQSFSSFSIAKQQNNISTITGSVPPTTGDPNFEIILNLHELLGHARDCFNKSV